MKKLSAEELNKISNKLFEEDRQEWLKNNDDNTDESESLSLIMTENILNLIARFFEEYQEQIKD